MSTRRRALAVLLPLAGAALSLYLVEAWPYLIRDPAGPPAGELPRSVEGTTEAVIMERFGPPSHRWHGHYAAPPVGYRRVYPDAVTVTYVRPTGVLYLSFCEERGQGVCFTSHWIPEGWVF
jgi:hypothetical protein